MLKALVLPYSEHFPAWLAFWYSKKEVKSIFNLIFSVWPQSGEPNTVTNFENCQKTCQQSENRPSGRSKESKEAPLDLQQILSLPFFAFKICLQNKSSNFKFSRKSFYNELGIYAFPKIRNYSLLDYYFGSKFHECNVYRLTLKRPLRRKFRISADSWLKVC